MFNRVIIPNMNFTVPQAINPHIAKESKAPKTFVEVVSKNVGKKNHINSRKILDKNAKILAQPQKDEVIISKDANLQHVIKKSKNVNYSNGKAIKNILSNFFDNSKQIERDQYKKDKAANLDKLVKDFEKERALDKNTYFAQKHEAKKLMMQDAITKLAEY